MHALPIMLGRAVIYCTSTSILADGDTKFTQLDAITAYITKLREGAVFLARYNSVADTNTWWQDFTKLLGTKICERATQEINVANAARNANIAGNNRNA